MTPLVILTFVVAPGLLDQIVEWLPLITLILKFLSALVGFLLSVTLASRRIRTWWRRRREPRG